MSRTQRTKGKAGELEVVKLLRRAFPEVARRSAGEESQEDRGRDLKNTPGWVVQVQLAQTPTPERKWHEAEGARRSHAEVAVAFTRRSAKRKRGGGRASGPWLATLLGDQLAALLEQKARAEKFAYEFGEDALRYKDDCAALIRERDDLKQKLATVSEELGRSLFGGGM